MSDEWYNEQFECRQTDPTLWWITALELHKAAEKVWEEYENVHKNFTEDPESFLERERSEGINIGLGLSRPYFLLMAMAIENLVKGILIGRDSDWVGKQKGLSHDILKYIEECGFDLEKDQCRLVSQMKPIIEWHGRYPIPKELEGWKLQRPKSGKVIRPGLIAPADKPQVEALFIILNNVLAEERKAKENE